MRSYGYQRLYGVKLALKEANLSGGVAGYKIELVALNDYADANETILQAQELVLDRRCSSNCWSMGADFV